MARVTPLPHHRERENRARRSRLFFLPHLSKPESLWLSAHAPVLPAAPVIPAKAGIQAVSSSECSSAVSQRIWIAASDSVPLVITVQSYQAHREHLHLLRHQAHLPPFPSSRARGSSVAIQAVLQGRLLISLVFLQDVGLCYFGVTCGVKESLLPYLVNRSLGVNVHHDIGEKDVASP